MMRRHLAIAIILTIAALGFRLFLVLQVPNDDDDDGRFYAQIARNLLDNRGYSGEEEEPFVPTYVRVPGYPLFLAGVYSAFGRDNNSAVRLTQVLLDTLTCWLIALLTFVWAPADWELERRRRSLLIALALSAACPFTAIYVTTILTETWATLLVTACALTATLALKSASRAKVAFLWAITGILGGAATMFRPDLTLFVGGAGVLLAVSGLRYVYGPRSASKGKPVVTMMVNCLVLLIAFAFLLAPWTIRNARTFGVFQPLAPLYANMPDEYAPLGYIEWLRTWVDDERYVSPVEDGLDLYQIQIELIPDYAFDSTEERERVAALLESYNNPSGASDESEEAADVEPGDSPAVKMTPELDARFAEIARERIARHPLRYYVALPTKRAVSIWFDTHSGYYPFQGQLFPTSDLDTEAHQQYWLPLFALLTWLYTLLAVTGAWVMWKNRSSRRWVVLLALMILPRLAFLAAQEHPESRYTVEFFALVAAAGGVALASLTLDRRRRSPTEALTPGRES